jgi:hypothetical protein
MLRKVNRVVKATQIKVMIGMTITDSVIKNGQDIDFSDPTNIPEDFIVTVASSVVK